MKLLTYEKHLSMCLAISPWNCIYVLHCSQTVRVCTAVSDQSLFGFLDGSVEDWQQSFRKKFSYNRRSKTRKEVTVIYY